MKISAYAFVLPMLVGIKASGMGYYCDPVSGNMANNGTQAQPLGSLQSVFESGKTFMAGDTLYLKTGNHGCPVVRQKNTGDVVITGMGGEGPVLGRVDFNGASHWKLQKVKISSMSPPPEPPVLNHPVYPLSNNTLVRILASTSIEVRDCSIFSIENPSAWTANDWNHRAWNGVLVEGGRDNTIDKCSIRNVNFGMYSQKATYVTLRNSTIENFCGDGIRPGSYSTLEYNIVKNPFQTNGNHYDAIQLYSAPASSAVIIRNVMIRGNTIIAATANRTPLNTGFMGISLFDGMYDSCSIENNVVSVSTGNGITILGGRNCRIVNNTLVRNPYLPSSTNPQLGIRANKTGTASTNNLVRNNLVASLNNGRDIGTVSNNIVSTAYADHFMDYMGFDCRLKATSPARNAGSDIGVPATDLLGSARSAPYDIGAYEYGSIVSSLSPAGKALGGTAYVQWIGSALRISRPEGMFGHSKGAETFTITGRRISALPIQHPVP